MKNRFYVITVQHNKEKDAENLNPTKAFDTLKEAQAYFHEQVGKDMKNSILDSSVNYIINNRGAVMDVKYWIDEEPEVEEAPIVDEVGRVKEQFDMLLPEQQAELIEWFKGIITPQEETEE